SSALNSVVVQHVCNFFAGQRLKAHKRVDVFFLVVGQELGGGIEGNAGIALDIDNVNYFDLRITFKRVQVSAQALVEVRLRRHGEDCDVAPALDLLCQALAACHSGLVIVSADKKEPLASGRVRVDRDDWNA